MFGKDGENGPYGPMTHIHGLIQGVHISLPNVFGTEGGGKSINGVRLNVECKIKKIGN